MLFPFDEEREGLATHWPHIARDLTRLHYLPDIADNFAEAWAVIRAQWDALLDDGGVFTAYFDTQWGVSSDFAFWGAFNTLAAYASTNNPVEIFNAIIKRLYTHRKRYSLAELIEIFGKIAFDYSTHITFETFPTVRFCFK